MTRNEFFNLQPLAIFGVSSRGSGFGATVFSELNKLGIKSYALNPKGGKIGSEVLHTSLAELPEKIQAAVILTRDEGAVAAVEECSRHNLEWVWLQGGSDKPEVRNLCTELGINVMRGQCIMMRRGSFPHSLHRYLHDLFLGES